MIAKITQFNRELTPVAIFFMPRGFGFSSIDSINTKSKGRRPVVAMAINVALCFVQSRLKQYIDHTHTRQHKKQSTASISN